MLKIGIINVTGYAGTELFRILDNHPEAEIVEVTGRSTYGEKISDILPYFSKYNLTIKNELSETVDVVFSALPHKVSAEILGPIVNNNIPTIDFSADFRLPKDIYEKTYNSKHPYPSSIKKFVYGLPELNRDSISKTKFISNPGCFPTCGILGLLPLKELDLLDVIIDAKTGISGAGKSGNIEHSFSEISDNFSAYSTSGHRHEPEIEYHFGKPVTLTTHLAPMTRGIFSTIYLSTHENLKIDKSTYTTFYDSHPFIKIVDNPPKLKDVRGTNECHIFVQELPTKNSAHNYRIFSVIDNLVKGAAGQAVHNFNLISNFEETLGLNNIALYP